MADHQRSQGDDNGARAPAGTPTPQTIDEQARERRAIGWLVLKVVSFIAIPLFASLLAVYVLL